MSYDTLNDNQKAGLAFNAAHNELIIEHYLDRLMANDGDRGYRELVASQMAGITTKLAAEPSIIADVTELADAKIAILEVAREQAKLEAAEAEKEPVEGLKEG